MRTYSKATRHEPRVTPDCLMPMTESERVQSIREARQFGRQGKRYELLVRWLLETGVRPGEALAAQWLDFDLGGRRWKIRGKYGERFASLSEVAVDILDSLRDSSDPAEDQVFHPIDRGAVGFVLKRRLNLPILRLRLTAFADRIAGQSHCLPLSVWHEMGFDGEGAMVRFLARIGRDRHGRPSLEVATGEAT